MTNKQIQKQLEAEVKKLAKAFDEVHPALAQKLHVTMVDELLPIAKCIRHLEELVMDIETSKK